MSLQEQSIDQPQIEVEKIENGHAFLKVLGLSNTKNLNNWQIPYNDVDELPKQLLDSFIGKPYVDSHANVILGELHKKLVSEGKTNEEINKEMHDKSMELKIGTIVDRFDPKPDDRVNVFYMVEIEDENENKYIKEHGKPTKLYSSPGVNGTLDRYENGDGVYHVDDVLGFHITAAENPAYGKFLAHVRGVCHKGMASECKRELGFASIIAPNIALSENINTNANINTNMSDTTSKTEVPESKINEINTSGNETMKNIDSKTHELDASFNKKFQEQNEEFSKLKSNYDKLSTDYKTLEASDSAKTKLLFNTMIESHVKPELFENNEEIVKKERENAYNFITKYKLDFDDAKDYLKKVYSKAEIIKPKEEVKKNSKDMKKETEKSDQYGELYNKEEYTKGERNDSESGSESNTFIDYTSELSEYV